MGPKANLGTLEVEKNHVLLPRIKPSFLSPGLQPRYCTDCTKMAAYTQTKIMHFSVAFHYRIITVYFSLQISKRRD